MIRDDGDNEEVEMTLAAFFTVLANSPVLHRQFAESEVKAREVMTEQGLTEEQQDLVLSQDLAAIKARIQYEDPEYPYTVFGGIHQQ